MRGAGVIFLTRRFRDFDQWECSSFFRGGRVFGPDLKWGIFVGIFFLRARPEQLE